MTTTQLAAIYHVTDRTIRNDCKAGIYPYSIRVISPKLTPAYKVQDFIPYAKRQTWLNIRMLPPSKYGIEEQTAYILAHNADESIRSIACHLGIDRMEVRRIFDQLYNEGKINHAYDLHSDAPTV